MVIKTWYSGSSQFSPSSQSSIVTIRWDSIWWEGGSIFVREPRVGGLSRATIGGGTSIGETMGGSSAPRSRSCSRSCSRSRRAFRAAIAQAATRKKTPTATMMTRSRSQSSMSQRNPSSESKVHSFHITQLSSGAMAERRRKLVLLTRLGSQSS